MVPQIYYKVHVVYPLSHTHVTRRWYGEFQQTLFCPTWEHQVCLPIYTVVLTVLLSAQNSEEGLGHPTIDRDLGCLGKD